MGDDDVARRFLELFGGSDRWHGTYGEPTQKGLKWIIKPTARTLRGPATVELWRIHLNGGKGIQRPGLGVAPICDGDVCWWGSIDVDEYDSDLVELIKQVKHLPFVPMRSKSGGLHLVVFFIQPQPRAELRDYLLAMQSILGTKGEVFPDQDALDEDKKPKWLCMPYGPTFEGKLRNQCGLKAGGAEMTQEEFLRSAAERRLPTIPDIEQSPERSASRGDADQALARWAGKLTSAAGGTSNKTLNDAAFFMGAFIKAQLIDPKKVRDELKRAGRLRGIPEDELEEVLSRVIRRGREKASPPKGRQEDQPFVPEWVVMADVPPEQVNWFWKDRIARGKLTIVGGNPGVNKSTVMMDIAARTTTGAPWPNSEGSAPQGSVLVLSAEDDIADTMHPRLLAAGGDPKRLHILKAMKRGGERRGFDLSKDLEHLENKVRELGDVVLIIIDPISAYMGKAGQLDSHRNTDVRSILDPVAEMAARCDVAIVALHHLTKGGDNLTLMSFLGSVAFVAAARSVYLVARDVDDSDGTRRLFLPVKVNIGPDLTGLAFRIVVRPATTDISVIAAQWEDGDVSITADEARMQSGGRKKPKLKEAKEFLLDILASGPVPVKVVEDRAAEKGISDKTLERARKVVGVETRKAGLTDGWEMVLTGGTGHLRVA